MTAARSTQRRAGHGLLIAAAMGWAMGWAVGSGGPATAGDVAAAPAAAQDYAAAQGYAATLDRELWAGISLGDAVAGAAVLGGGAVAIAAVTGSTALAVAAAAVAAVSFVVFDPGAPGVVSPTDLPLMSSGGVLPETK